MNSPVLYPEDLHTNSIPFASIDGDPINPSNLYDDIFDEVTVYIEIETMTVKTQAQQPEQPRRLRYSLLPPIFVVIFLSVAYVFELHH
jgi:hypothetical protein